MGYFLADSVRAGNTRTDILNGMKIRPLIVAASLMALAACTPGVQNEAGTPTVYRPIDAPSETTGTGIEAQDVAAMTDVMARDLLSMTFLFPQNERRRVIIDDKYFKNSSRQMVDVSNITNKLRSAILRESQGRVRVVSRTSSKMVEQERELKREGVTDTGSAGMTKATLGADYRLVGEITEQTARDGSTGAVDRTFIITFELVDLENAELMWSNTYDFRKYGGDDVIYR